MGNALALDPVVDAMVAYLSPEDLGAAVAAFPRLLARPVLTAKAARHRGRGLLASAGVGLQAAGRAPSAVELRGRLGTQLLDAVDACLALTSCTASRTFAFALMNKVSRLLGTYFRRGRSRRPRRGLGRNHVRAVVRFTVTLLERIFTGATSPFRGALYAEGLAFSVGSLACEPKCFASDLRETAAALEAAFPDVVRSDAFARALTERVGPLFATPLRIARVTEAFPCVAGWSVRCAVVACVQADDEDAAYRVLARLSTRTQRNELPDEFDSQGIESLGRYPPAKAFVRACYALEQWVHQAHAPRLPWHLWTRLWSDAAKRNALAGVVEAAAVSGRPIALDLAAETLSGVAAPTLPSLSPIAP